MLPFPFCGLPHAVICHVCACVRYAYINRLVNLRKLFKLPKALRNLTVIKNEKGRKILFVLKFISLKHLENQNF